MTSLRRLVVPALLALASFAMCFFVLISPAPAGGDVARVAVPKQPAQPDVLADVVVTKLSWTSIYFGGFAGYGAADGVVSSGPLSVDGLSATGRIIGLTAGADWQLPSSFLVIGARANYSWSDENFTVAPSLFKAGLRDGWSVDGRIGAALGTAMPYIGAGLTNVHTATSIAGFSSPDLRGIRYFGGVEFRLPKMDTGTLLTPTLAVEVVYTDFDSKSLGGSTKLDVTDLAGMVRLNLHVGR